MRTVARVSTDRRASPRTVSTGSRPMQPPCRMPLCPHSCANACVISSSTRSPSPRGEVVRAELAALRRSARRRASQRSWHAVCRSGIARGSLNGAAAAAGQLQDGHREARGHPAAARGARYLRRGGGATSTSRCSPPSSRGTRSARGSASPWAALPRASMTSAPGRRRDSSGDDPPAHRR